MPTVACLTSAEVRRKISVLRSKFEEVKRHSEAAERKGRQIDKQIEDLQAQCPHKHTKREYVQDVAEMKLRRFCTDCGSQC